MAERVDGGLAGREGGGGGLDNPGGRRDLAAYAVGSPFRAVDQNGALLKISVGLLYKHNAVGLRLWEERRSKVGKLVPRETKSPAKQKALGELLEVAVRMESMFLNRTQHIAEKQATIQGRRDEIKRSLLDLDRSKLKLESSRMLSRERENLNRAIAELVGTPPGRFRVHGGLWFT